MRSIGNGPIYDEVISHIAHPNEGPGLVTDAGDEIFTNEANPPLLHLGIKLLRHQFTYLDGGQVWLLAYLGQKLGDQEFSLEIHVALLYVDTV